ncbi:VOC family protein [Mesorhizobium amorphae]|uniref:VOC family protein n=1 Tax=Mesorhizobium amorphae TaxID=71433 RepID=UPI0016425BE3|nr:VOC family protein [Mesorhizobium amorphae]
MMHPNRLAIRSTMTVTAQTHPPIEQTISFFRVSDLRRTRDFYERAFGLRLVFEREGKVLILQATGESFFGFVTGELPANQPRMGAITLVSSDVDAWSKRLVELGIETKGPPIFKPEFGIYILYVTDPDGYTVEVLEMRAEGWPHKTL